MADESTEGVAISVRPAHGTAKRVAGSGLIPREKRAAEVFWVSALLGRLEEFADMSFQVMSNLEDSDGQDDVRILLPDRPAIGVQVTEFTSELERARQAQAGRFVEDFLDEIESRQLSADPRVIADCLMSYATPKQEVCQAVHVLVDEIARFIETADCSSRNASIGTGAVVLRRVVEGDTYVPQRNGIGVNCSLGAVPRSARMYKEAADLIFEKKSDSLSDWLLIWSSEFWRDAHWLSENVVGHLRSLFIRSKFQRVYFAESLDGPGIFEANLNVTAIKA